MQREGKPLALLLGMQTGLATLTKSMAVPQEIKIELPCHPAIALLGICPRDTGVLFRRDMCTTMFIAELSTIAKVWKEPKCPSMDEWIKKMWYIYMQWGITWQSQRMKSCNYVDGTGGYYAKQTKSEKDRYHVISLICGI